MKKFFQITIILLLIFVFAQIACTSLQPYQCNQCLEGSPCCISNTTGGDMTYKFETTTFSLEVNITTDNLTIRLKDFTDWIIYEKSYTDDDIGKGEIHRKVDLFDIYRIITQKSRKNCDKKTQKQVQNQQESKFGETIQTNNINCYNIQKGGKIKIYLKLSAANCFKNQINCDSHLLLNKLKDMSQTQILIERLKIENRILQRQIKKLKLIKKKNKKELQQTKQELQQQKQKSYASQIQIRRCNLDQFNNYMHLFNVINNKTTIIEYLGENAWTLFIFDEPLPYNQIYEFKIRIIKTVKSQIMIGVIDYKRQKQQRSSYGSNAVAYNGSNGQKTFSQLFEGPGFKEGQIIDVSVDLSNKIIKWSVSGKQRASYAHQMLGDKSRKFMPYVQMYNTNDTVQFIK